MSTSISLTPDERNTLLDYYRAPLGQPEPRLAPRRSFATMLFIARRLW